MMTPLIKRAKTALELVEKYEREEKADA